MVKIFTGYSTCVEREINEFLSSSSTMRDKIKNMCVTEDQDGSLTIIIYFNI